MALVACSGGESAQVPVDAADVPDADPCADAGGWGGPDVPVTRATNYSEAMVADATHVYWTQGLTCTTDGDCLPGPVLLRAPLSSGEPEVLLESETEEGQPGGALAVHPSGVYLSVREALLRVPLDGGPPVEISSAPCGDIAADEEAIYFVQDGALVRMTPGDGMRQTLATSDCFGADLQRVGDALYWARREPAEVWRVPVTGGEPERLARFRGTLKGLAVSDSGAFIGVWSSEMNVETGTLFRVPLEGGEPQPLAAMLDHMVNDTIADEGHVYWTESFRRNVVRVPVAGGCPQNREVGAPRFLAISGEEIIIMTGAAIVRAPR